MSYIHFIDGKHQVIQTRLLEDQNHWSTSCESLHKRRAINIVDGRKKNNHDKKNHDNKIRKAQTAINCYINKIKNKLKAKGIQACKKEKTRKKRLQKFLSWGKELLIGIDLPIFYLEKHFSNADLKVFLPQFFLETLDVAMLVSEQKP